MDFQGDYVFKIVQGWMADAYSAWDYANQNFTYAATDTGVNVSITAPGRPYVYLSCVALIWKA